jgi:hypothetical protein
LLLPRLSQTRPKAKIGAHSPALRETTRVF